MAEKIVEIPSIISVRDLAARVRMSPINIIRELMNNGVMASINQQIDFDTAAIVLQGLGFEPHEEKKIEEVSTEDLSGTLWNRLYAKEDPNKSEGAPARGHDHGPRRSWQDLAVGCRPPHRCGERRSGRHYAAHRRVSSGTQWPQDHVPGHTRT